MKPSESDIKDVEKFFVDRKSDFDEIQKTLLQDEASHRVYFIGGQSDIGKSWLLYRLYRASEKAGWSTVFIDFRYGQGFTNYVSILEDIQLTLDQDFRRYLRRTSEMLQIRLELGTGEGDAGTGILFESGADLDGVIIPGQVAARDIVNLKIREFYAQVKDHRSLQQLHIIQPLTESFIEDLVDFIRNKRVIFLLDDVGTVDEETLDVETRKWLINDFVRPLCRDERLKTVRFVITQDGELDRELMRPLGTLAKRHTLKPFAGDEDTLFAIYRTFLVEKHDFDPELVNELFLRMFHKQVGGIPGLMNDMTLELY